MKTRCVLPAILVLGSVLMLTASEASAFQTPLTTIRVASGMANPLYVTAAPGDTSRIFIVEQRSGTVGRIRILNIPANTLNATPFLSVSPVLTADEQGLLGMAFDPDYNNNGYFYVDYTATGGGAAGHETLARYTVSTHVPGYVNPSPDIADPASAVVMLTINDPENNHNGGGLMFGPDGMLYYGVGDGGGGGDAHTTNCSYGNGQCTSTLLGKLMRLDVNNPPTYIPADNPSLYGAAIDQKWALGLRNPFRFSFDRQNGDLYIGDVGQNAVEEIDYTTFATGAARNYGWRCREGNTNFNCTNATTICSNCGGSRVLTEPIYAYAQGAGTGFCVIGGYVYRGLKIPDLKGTYFFADYSSARIWSFKVSGGVMTNFITRTTELAPGGGLSITSITSFGEDADGEIYICKRGSGANGEVYKIVVSCAGASESFTTQPASQNATTGQAVFFTVAVSGSRGLTSYAWTKDGNPIGTNSPTLSLSSVTCHDNGTYVCTVIDQCGSPAVSDPATLSVTPLPAGDIEGDCDCDLADADALVNVLLGLDVDPGHVSRADVNGDLSVDSLDIQAFIDTMPNWPC